MATYSELFGLWNESSLKNRIMVAVIVAAEAIQNESPTTPNHANRLVWAQQTFQNPSSIAYAMFRVVLAANKDVTVQAILDATDAAIQTAVDAAVDTFATGG